MLKGPETFEQWRSSWRVFRAAMIMLGAARPSTLDAYEEGLRQLTILFPHGWGTLVTADEIMRSERWEVALEQAMAAPPPGMDEQRPWDYIILNSAYGRDGVRSHWWETRVVLPLLQGASHRQAGTTAARLESSFTVPSFAASASSGAPPPPQPFAGPPLKKSKTQRQREAKARAYEDGKKTGGGGGAQQPAGQFDLAGARAKQFCHAWNKYAEGCSSPCPNMRQHACMLCGGSHRSINCQSGKGKGKGKKAQL